MKISVALCTYNGQKYLEAQLESIISQTYSVDEIIVCDDGSKDNTLSILNNYSISYPNLISIYKNDQNLGSSKNFEKAIKLCAGDIIFLSDQDDLWESNKVNEFIEFFNRKPDINVVCSNGHIIDENSSPYKCLTIWDVPKLLIHNGEKIDYFHSIAYCGNIATGAAMAFRRDFLQTILPIPLTSDMYHDEWLALISSYQHSFSLLDKKLFSYRMHSEQIVGNTWYPNTVKARNKLLKRFSKNNRSISTLKRRIKKATLIHNTLIKYKNNVIIDCIRKDIFDTRIAFKKQIFKTYPVIGQLVITFDQLKSKHRLFQNKTRVL